MPSHDAIQEISKVVSFQGEESIIYEIEIASSPGLPPSFFCWLQYSIQYTAWYFSQVSDAGIERKVENVLTV